MWNTTPADRMRRSLAALGLILAAACSPASEAQPPAPEPTRAAPAVVEASPTPSPTPSEGASRVIGKTDMTLRGKPACRVAFAYAGRPDEDLFWEEPCANVTAKLMTQADLESLGKWDRLDEFARKFIAARPDGKVLYVEGSFSASVYPIGTTGETYEVSVTD
ncbi:hypothetical protein [Sphingomonas sp. Y38-1Y]|uniref:hypothetical protein n=1 Tax=Sphingomonas sp. Y38-1Y TaxID=3078265 RepID=UPI0028ED451B|nr:hypothetical protein [Sphingomonas sp. Y38-1Y]